jgi:hypothetical protein
MEEQVNVTLKAVGKPRKTALNIPKEVVIAISRDDGFAPTLGEVYAALNTAIASLEAEREKMQQAAK